MNINLRFGNDTLPFDVPDNANVLEISEPDFDITVESFRNGFNKLLHSGSEDCSNVGIVISDKTRLCDYHLYLPWLMEALARAGARPENITFYVAYGTHPFQSRPESIISYGEITGKYKFIHHDSTELAVFKNLGLTKRGTPVLVRRDALESSLLITFGAISHHYFAGFGGGRKLLFPGLGEKQAIYHNHSLFLNFENKMLEEGCQPGRLTGNPVAEDLKEINDLLPERLSIHGILNSKGKVCKFLFGNNYDDFVKACNTHDSYFKSKSDIQYDMVIASSGGYPKDINFIQAHKSIHHSAAFVKEGGILIVLTECRDGIGTNTFLPLFREESRERMFDKLSEKYEGNGGTALAMKAKTERIKIFMLTNLDDATCSLIGTKKSNIHEMNELINHHRGSMAIIENASVLIK